MSDSPPLPVRESWGTLAVWVDMARAEATGLAGRARAAREHSAALVEKVCADAVRRRAGSTGLNLGTAFALADMTTAQVWFEYAALGGRESQSAVTDFLAGRTAWPDLERQIMAHVLNERLMDEGISPVARYLD